MWEHLQAGKRGNSEDFLLERLKTRNWRQINKFSSSLERMKLEKKNSEEKLSKRRKNKREKDKKLLWGQAFRRQREETKVRKWMKSRRRSVEDKSRMERPSSNSEKDLIKWRQEDEQKIQEQEDFGQNNAASRKKDKLPKKKKKKKIISQKDDRQTVLKIRQKQEEWRSDECRFKGLLKSPEGLRQDLEAKSELMKPKNSSCRWWKLQQKMKRIGKKTSMDSKKDISKTLRWKY